MQQESRNLSESCCGMYACQMPTDTECLEHELLHTMRICAWEYSNACLFDHLCYVSLKTLGQEALQ